MTYPSSVEKLKLTKGGAKENTAGDRWRGGVGEQQVQVRLAAAGVGNRPVPARTQMYGA